MEFVDVIFRKNFLVSGFEILKGEIDDIYTKSFLRYRFENLLTDISNSNTLFHLCGWVRFYKFNNLTIISTNYSLIWIKQTKYFCKSEQYYLNSTNYKKFNNSVHKLFVDNNEFSKVKMFL